jgi:hypothetical protein
MRPHMPSWIVVEHDACEAAHGAQRCAQIMRDRVAECFELSIGRIELNSAFLDAAFELLIETPDFVLGLLARSDIEIDSDQAMQLAGVVLERLEPARDRDPPAVAHRHARELARVVPERRDLYGLAGERAPEQREPRSGAPACDAGHAGTSWRSSVDVMARANAVR